MVIYMKKQPDITAGTRKVFVDVFCELYKDMPIKKITIQEITNKANYNRSTFYQYFKDVYDLLTYLEDMVISYVKENINANLLNTDANVIDTFIASFTNMKEEMETYVEALLGNPNSTKFAERLKLVMLPVFMEQFQISETDTKSVYVIDFFLSGLISMAKRWMLDGHNIPTEELGRMLHALLNNGVLSALD